jgi:GAF domain-containing protein
MVANTQITVPRVATSFGKQKLSLLTVFDRQRRQSLIWFLLAIAAWVLSAWDRHQLVEQLTRKREVLLIDSLGTYYVSPVVDIQQAKDLHAMQTKLACKALFERNPEGLDNPELFKQLFLREAAQTAQAALNKTKAEFEAKSLHQKVEVGLPEILSTRDDAFYTSADVQLIRVGSFQGAPITEVLRYRVKFKFLVNPDLTRNGRFPTAVAAFQVEPINRT